MSVLLVIPARYASTRYEGKPLVPLTGATGVTKPLIQRTWEAALKAGGVDRVVVATDDERIYKVSEGFGAEVIMTPASCENGTERCAAVLELVGSGHDIVLNLQGDAPLTPHWFIEALIEELIGDEDVQAATPVLKANAATRASFVADRSAGRIGATTAVFARNRDALYFSKEILPHGPGESETFHHVGLYGFREVALKRYVDFGVGPLELAEGLEQLRFLENGIAMRCVIVQDRCQPFWEVNNPEDLPIVETMLAKVGLP